MTAHEELKALMPNMPSEVFDIFLSPLIPDLGWSADADRNLIILNNRFSILGAYSLSELAPISWQSSTFFINIDILHPCSKDDIAALIIDHVCNNGARALQYIAQTKERFSWHVEFICRTRSICAPLVMTRTNFGLRILDGNHRLAALFALNLENEISVSAWIGE